MRTSVWALVASLAVAGCASPYFEARVGHLGGSLVTMWVEPEIFVYVPASDPTKTLAFESPHTGHVITPGLMYTDGGSIPRVAQAIKGFSPWGYGPAYVVHDWIFYGRHCLNDADLPGMVRREEEQRFADVLKVSFDDSAIILAEVIKTLAADHQVGPGRLAPQVISAAVDSSVAGALWTETGACKSNRVSPRHIAIVWLRFVPDPEHNPPPPSWKLSASEVRAARGEFANARKFLKSNYGEVPPHRRRPPRMPGRPVAELN